MRFAELIALMQVVHWWIGNSLILKLSEFYWFSSGNKIPLQANSKDPFKAAESFYSLQLFWKGRLTNMMPTSTFIKHSWIKTKSDLNCSKVPATMASSSGRWQTTGWRRGRRWTGTQCPSSASPSTPAGVATASVLERTWMGTGLGRGHTCHCTSWWCEGSLTPCCSGRSGRGWP